ncbi:hypothetical protein Nepgr_017524 [Nepenthes gracilis]|uniref:Integrase catalytic domain-containing protein n=1 Tax=Nepenthes gracilis TaxID=150966 RepID=A0AAD3SQJ0_NEPGR|nr:hypothetical protein Nepgr_017524 [Nepenthes gracilis]
MAICAVGARQPGTATFGFRVKKVPHRQHQLLYQVIVPNNRTQFTGKRFTKYCTGLRIRLVHTFVAYPQANGSVEVTNHTLLHRLKTKLEDVGGTWVDELPSILWSYGIIPREPTRETPFSLCYGTEAAVPAEVGLPCPWVECFDLITNSQRFRECLDLLPEVCDVARLRSVTYQQHIARYYNKRVKACPLEVGNLVLRSVEVAEEATSRSKLSRGWEGPFLVSAIL